VSARGLKGLKVGCGLFNGAVSISGYRASIGRKWKGFGTKWPWPDQGIILALVSRG
jgi:hypothetical protein